MKRKLALLLSILMLLPAFSACGGSASADVPVAELVTALSGTLSNADKLTDAGGDYVSGMLELDTDLFREYVLMLQTKGTEIDQYGIFRVRDIRDAESVASTLENYLRTMRNNWDALPYLPEERPKLDQAAVRTVGEYVVFTILSAEDTEALNAQLDRMLKP